MKKFIITFLAILSLSVPCFADTIYNNNVAVLQGKIEGVMDGLINIKSMGNVYTIVRKEPSPVFKDTVIARRHLISRQTIRYSGVVVFADSSEVKILCEDTKVVIPRYRVKTIDIYVP